MNNYPPYWTDTITVFNKYENPTTKQITWHKTVLTGCFFKYSNDSLISAPSQLGYSAIRFSGNTAICRVPKNKKYRTKSVWDSTATKTNIFTFAPNDIVVKGAVASTDTIDEYTSGKRSSDFIASKKKTSDCFVIEKVSINTGDFKGCEHYYLTGM